MFINIYLKKNPSKSYKSPTFLSIKEYFLRYK